MNDPGLRRWDGRYGQQGYLFVEQSNAFLARQRHRLASRVRALAVADGEGRNGVWLAEQGLEVVFIDGWRAAQEKARRLAERRGVEITCKLADLTRWTWPGAACDVVAGIFIQFAGRAAQSDVQGHGASAAAGWAAPAEGYRGGAARLRHGRPFCRREPIHRGDAP
ncbi:methyltransferase domain-containing protein [Phenylobacterium sp. J426]|uniref:methyltransferase domain-containing protein n=1 Tax=Phenylobacterium sp. J426 TaxID=2898439 RepID=UPI0035B3EC45